MCDRLAPLALQYTQESRLNQSSLKSHHLTVTPRRDAHAQASAFNDFMVHEGVRARLSVQSEI